MSGGRPAGWVRTGAEAQPEPEAGLPEFRLTEARGPQGTVWEARAAASRGLSTAGQRTLFGLILGEEGRKELQL